MLACALAAPTAAAAAAVPTGSMTSVDDLEAPHRLRRGLVVGLELGAGPAGASGYPNDVTRIGDPNDYSASGWMAGGLATISLLGALTDYLSFGFWYAHAAAVNGRWQSRGDGVGLRIEAFPLVAVAPPLGGLGVRAQFGLGSGQLTSKVLGAVTSEGTQSFAGAGVFYEWPFGRVLGGHLAAGPTLDYDAIWSLPFESHGLTAGVRLAFYGGP